MSAIIFLLVFATTCLLTTNGFVFQCIDFCLCDTEEALISCNNKVRNELPLPMKKLRGFLVLNVMKNDIRILPTENEILEKLPGLKGLDLFGNPSFDCTQLSDFKHLHIISECNNSTSQKHSEINIFFPTHDTINSFCDMQCNWARHANSVKEYMKDIWSGFLDGLEWIDNTAAVQTIEHEFNKLKTVVLKWIKEQTSNSISENSTVSDTTT